MPKDYHNIFCPYFAEEVILTDERTQHIRTQHPDLLPGYRNTIDDVISKPDIIRSSSRMPNGYLFTKWCPEVQNGKYVIVVIVSEALRKWVITSYISRKLPKGDILWIKD
jgi:hypothetical protein